MSTITSIVKLARQVNRLKLERAQPLSTTLNCPIHSQNEAAAAKFSKNRTFDSSTSHFGIKDVGTAPQPQRQIGENVSRKDKISFLVTTLMDLPDSKKAVYSTLDSWVAWERNFPLGALKQALLTLEKEQEWHKIIQVIKWMLSKGQGTTQATYGQLIQALDMDHRVEEAHEIWKKKLAFDLHSVPWKLCKLMISVYHRNNMLEDLVKLFKGLEAYDRKPPEKSIVRKVTDAYEMLGLNEEKERVLEKYKNLFIESSTVKLKKNSCRHSPKKRKPSQKG